MGAVVNNGKVVGTILKTNADFIVHILESLGINTAFGVAGGFIEPLVNSMARSQRQGNFRIISAKHESGAAMMCDGFYRKTGKPSLCFATAGPGITNMLTGIACAYQDHIPIIIITPLNSSDNHGRGALQESSKSGVDVAKMLEACTVLSETITHPKQIPHKLHTAYISALFGDRIGPVNISIPVEILRDKAIDLQFNMPFCLNKNRNRVQDEQVDVVEEILATNITPVFVYGEQMLGTQLQLFLALVLKYNAKVVEVPMSKGSIPYEFPNYEGVYGFAGHESATKAISEAGAIICFGVDINEVSTKTWAGDILSSRTIIITNSISTVIRSQCVGDTLLCDVDEFILELTKRLKVAKLPMYPSYHEKEMEVVDSAENGELHHTIKPSTLFRTLSEMAPPNTNVYFDSGNAFIWGTHLWNGRRTNNYTKRLCYTGFGFAAMGWAIGASIGAGIASEDFIICVTGDGSYLMAGQEITTALQNNAKVMFVILNDSSYGMVKHGQRLAQAEPVGFELPKIDFAKMANAMGILSYTINSLKDLVSLPMREISIHCGPTLIDVRIDPEEVPPMGDRMKALSTIN